MYNENVKRTFIKEITHSESTAKDYQSLFDACEAYENEISKDICQMDEQELQYIVDKLIGIRGQSRTSRLIRLRTYTKWCINAKIDNARDAMLNIKSAGLNRMRACTVSSPTHLDNWLNQLYTPTEDKTVDCVYRCFVWLAYSGVNEDDILSLTEDNIDLDEMEVHYNGKSYPIYREAVPTLKNCIELKQFSYLHPNYNKIVWKERAPGKQLIRGLKEAKSVKIIRTALSRHIKQQEAVIPDIAKLSYFRIWLSGVFYRTYESERMGFEPNFMDIVEDNFRGRTYKLDSGRNTLDAKKSQKHRDYLEDYKRWKLAFNI
jgi:site-specific recombinase XerC